MKVSLNLIKQYTDIDLSVDELVAKINQQLGGVEEVTDLGKRYAGAVNARIVSCDDHADADRLHVCRIDDGGVTPDVERGEDGLVQVVCGAPNARAGILVVWLPPGATVPSSFADAEPFVLGSRPLRGIVSHGMLASPRELGIGDGHEGILEIAPAIDAPYGHADDAKPGASFAVVFGLDDTIIDIENKMFTHRPDCFGQLGVAREIAGIQHKQFVSPKWYIDEPQFVGAEGLSLEVRNEINDAVPRFMAVTIKDIEVKPSPLWLQIELVRLGSRPINNIVDVTNYVMQLTGQPLHAYDYDKVLTGVLGARRASEGETVALLNGKTLKLDTADIVITDGDKPIGLGGVMGGADTEISAETKSIILECATFDMYTIRKTSMRHGLFTDAVTRFNKGQSPLQNSHILNLAMMSVHDVAGGSQASAVIDTSHDTEAPQPLTVSPEFINKRLGLQLGGEEMAALLRNVEFAVESYNDLSVRSPFWRTDIELPEDIVEEIGRLYGFDKLPRQLPERSIKPAAKSPVFELKRSLRGQMSRLGANEILTYSFVHKNVLERTGQNLELAYRLGNALSPDLQYYRVSLLPSLLDKVHANSKAGYDEFAIYELGKAHVVGEYETIGGALPREVHALGLVYAAKQPQPGAAYYKARRYLDSLLDTWQVAGLVAYEPLAGADLYQNPWLEQMVAPFEPGRSAVLRAKDGLAWGVVGEFKPAVRKAFKLPEYAAGFELDPTLFLQADHRSGYIPLPRFPKVWQDISLRVPSALGYQQLYDFIRKQLVGHESKTMLSTLTPTSIYQNPGDTAHKHVTLRYSVASYDKTMTDTEVAGMLDAAAAATAKSFQAARI